MKAKLDFSKFKHIKSTENATTLQHPDGHMITVAHKPLSKENQTVLKSLAQSAETPEDATEIRQQKMAEGGKPIGANKPGESSTADSSFAYDHSLPCLNPSCKSHGKPHPNCRCYTRMAEGGKASGMRYCAHGMPHEPDCEYYMAEGSKPQENPKLEESKPAENKLDYQEIKRDYIDKNQTKFVKGEKRKMYADPDEPVSQDDSAPIEEITPKQGIRLEAESHPVKETIHSILDWAKNKAGEFEQNERNFGAQQSGMPAPQDQAAPTAQATPTSTATADTPPSIYPDDASPQSDTTAQPAAQSATAQAAPQQPQAQAPQPAGPVQTTPTQAPQLTPNAQKMIAGNNLPPEKVQQIAQDSDEMRQKAAAWEEDLKNGHIDPKTYENLFAKKSTLSKISTAFGLLLGGIGSGWSGQPNVVAPMVMGMMKDEMQKDFDAQRQSKENARNFLTMTYQHELQEAQARGLDASSELTKKEAALKAQELGQIYQNITGFHKLTTLVDKTTDPKQKQLGIQALSMMYPTMSVGNSNAADRYAVAKAMMGGENEPGNPKEAALDNQIKAFNWSNPDMARKMQEARIPGIGISKDFRPIPADTKNQVTSMQTLDNQISDLISATQKYSTLRGNFDPNVLREMATKAHETAALYNKTLDGLGMTQGRMDWLEKQIPNEPQKFMERLKGSLAGLKEVQRNNLMRRNTLLKSVNIDAPEASQSAAPAQTSKSGRPIRQRADGKWEYAD